MLIPCSYALNFFFLFLTVYYVNFSFIFIYLFLYSFYSALTSGLISPSDLPDSPGEVMSPVLTDKDNSPKIKSSKANSDNESENIELCQKPKLISEHVMENKSACSPVQIPNSKVSVFMLYQFKYFFILCCCL